MADAASPPLAAAAATAATAIDPLTLLGSTPAHVNATPVDLLAALEAYRTGYLLVDALLCLLLPILLQQLLTFLQNGGDGSTTLLAPLVAWLWKKDDGRTVERTIEITQRFNRDGYKVWDWEQTNHLLQKAISLYLSEVLDLDNKDAKYELLQKPRKKDQLASGDDDRDSVSQSGGSVTSSSSAYDSDDDDDDGYNVSEVEKLSVEALPMINTWIQVEDGILFKHEVVTPENPGEHKGVTETKIVYRFTSTLPDGSDRIEALIEKAYSNYQEAERRKVKEDKARYFYIQSGTKAPSSDAEKVAYKRYALGEEKTFENLFFEEKAQVQQLLDNFANKTGKFAIKGFPYKLGFLLHGPPGTGKTSLIKAIAQYTKRHIVTINLGKIQSNQELMDAVFDLKFAIQGLDSPVEYNFEDVIFVMEDIDCASSIVSKRADETTKKETAAVEEDHNKSTDAETLDTDTHSEKTKETPTATIRSDDDKLMSMMFKLVMDDEKKHAKLNLAGLLNVLDGVIDCPGRIIIMTTNHPEKLDPALVRPGRVNKKLLLSYMTASQVRLMIEYYTTTQLTSSHAQRLERILERAQNRVSPAQVEEMCAEYDTTDAILDGLARLAGCRGE